jgi:hypothetical protein
MSLIFHWKKPLFSFSVCFRESGEEEEGNEETESDILLGLFFSQP